MSSRPTAQPGSSGHRLGPIGELTAAWAYSLPDGTGTPRQLTDPAGEVTFAASYTPWGDTLETFGTGRFTQGYFGGIMDAATGLIYVGNGQYYDPATGRFLTRRVHPNSTNPYVPWGGDPTGFLFAPLALLVLVYGRKRKRGKLDTFLIVLVLGCAIGMSLTACDLPTPTPGTPPTSEQTETPIPPQPSETPGPGQGGGGSPTPAGEPSRTPSPTCTDTLTPTPSLTPTPTGTQPPPLASAYNTSFTEAGTKWEYIDQVAAVDAVVAVATKFAGILGGSPLSAWLSTYGKMTFQMGSCDQCEKDSKHAGYTNGEHYIEFAGISDASPKGRNLVVHELGHAFKWDLYRKTGIDCYEEFKTWRKNHQGYPDRPDYVPPEDGSIRAGGYHGFASQQNVIVWQQSLEGKDSEEFAYQFLGWTFNMWQTQPNGSLHPDGIARKDMMDANMPDWVKKVAGLK